MSVQAHREAPRHFTQALAALIAAVAAAQIAMAWWLYGFLTGDDVEVLAEAFRVATGFSYRAWDIRNLFVPDFVVAPAIWLAHAAGVVDVRMLSAAAALPFVAATAATSWLLYVLMMRWTADPRSALFAAAVYALHWIPLGFGSTVYPRTIATLAIVGAVVLLDVRDSHAAAAIAGALAGVAFADRFSEIVYLVPLLILARRRALALLAGFAASVFVLVGIYDRITWGEWFGSLRRFAHLTLIQSDFASRLKHQSATWYANNLLRWVAPTLLPFFWWARRERPARIAALLVFLPPILLSFVAHKELRYLQGVVPWIAVAAGIGFGLLWREGRRVLAMSLLVVGIAWDFAGLRAFAHKSMPAVAAAQILGRDPAVRTVAMSQLWAYGDRLYFTDRKDVIDVGTPPRDLDRVLPLADAACLYETDLTPEIDAQIARNGFAPVRTFRWGPARAVIVYRRISR